MDYSSKAERCGYKTNYSGYEDIAETSATYLENNSDGGQEPAIGENMGLPRKLFDEQEVQIFGEASRFAVREVFEINWSSVKR